MRFDAKILKYLSLITQIGLMMAIPVIGCILLGHYLDNKFNTDNVFLIILTIIGVLASFRNLFVIGMKASNKKRKD